MAEPDLEALERLAAEMVDRALRAGADVAEAVARSGHELVARVRRGEAELVEEAGHRSVGMRVMKGHRVALVSTSDLGPAGVDVFLRDAIDLASVTEEDPFAGPADPDLVARGPAPDLDLFDPAVARVGAAEAVDRARAAEAAALGHDPRVRRTEGATFSRTDGAMACVLSGGFRAAWRGSWAALSASAVVEDEGGKRRRGSWYSARRHLRDLDDGEEVGREAARRALRKIGARRVRTCEAPVVFDPEVGRSLVGALVGCASAGAIWRRASYLVGREGTEVASALVTVEDDPLVPRGPGSRPFDGEGLPSRRNVIVERGVLRTYLCDSYGARKLGRRPTGSASRGGAGGVGVGTTNCTLRPGNVRPDEVLGSTDRGLYVTETMGFGLDPVTGDYSRGAAGFWIEDGAFAFPVDQATISGNLDGMLRRIDLVADDLDLRTATAAPTFRVASMTIAGE